VRLTGFSARAARSWTHRCHQSSSTKVNVGQRKGGERARGVLGQAALANLAEAPQALDHAQHMLGTCADARRAAVLLTRGLVNFALPVARTASQTPCRALTYGCLLAGAHLRVATSTPPPASARPGEMPGSRPSPTAVHGRHANLCMTATMHRSQLGVGRASRSRATQAQRGTWQGRRAKF